MVYILPRNRARSLVQASRITPPLRGSRRDQGGARSRAGGGQTRRPVSDDQRHYRRRGGGYWLAPPPHQPSPAARLLRLPLEGGVIPAVLTDDILDTLDREHGLHRAKESGKKLFAGLKNHSPLEGESARPGRSPQSSRRGGTRRPVSDDQRHYRRQGGGYWLAPPPHQPSPVGSASATPPQGGSDTRGTNR